MFYLLTNLLQSYQVNVTWWLACFLTTRYVSAATNRVHTELWKRFFMTFQDLYAPRIELTRTNRMTKRTALTTETLLNHGPRFHGWFIIQLNSIQLKIQEKFSLLFRKMNNYWTSQWIMHYSLSFTLFHSLNTFSTWQHRNWKISQTLTHTNQTKINRLHSDFCIANICLAYKQYTYQTINKLHN